METIEFKFGNVRTTIYEGVKYYVANDVVDLFGLYKELIKKKVSDKNKIKGCIKGLKGEQIKDPALATESKFGKHYPTWINFEGVKELAEFCHASFIDDLLYKLEHGNDKKEEESISNEIEVADFKLIVQLIENGNFKFQVKSKLSYDLIRRTNVTHDKLAKTMIASYVSSLNEEFKDSEKIKDIAMIASCFLNTEQCIEQRIKNEVEKRMKEQVNG